MGIDWKTPGYMIRSELGREKMRTRTDKEAWNFERKLEKGKGGTVARKLRFRRNEGEMKKERREERKMGIRRERQ